MNKLYRILPSSVIFAVTLVKLGHSILVTDGEEDPYRNQQEVYMYIQDSDGARALPLCVEPTDERRKLEIQKI